MARCLSGPRPDLLQPPVSPIMFPEQCLLYEREEKGPRCSDFQKGSREPKKAAEDLCLGLTESSAPSLCLPLLSLSLQICARRLSNSTSRSRLLFISGTRRKGLVCACHGGMRDGFKPPKEAIKDLCGLLSEINSQSSLTAIALSNRRERSTAALPLPPTPPPHILCHRELASLDGNDVNCPRGPIVQCHHPPVSWNL